MEAGVGAHEQLLSSVSGQPGAEEQDEVLGQVFFPGRRHAPTMKQLPQKLFVFSARLQ